MANNAPMAAIQLLWRCMVFTSDSHRYSYRFWTNRTLGRHAPAGPAEYSLGFCICRTLHQFGGWRATIEVGARLYFQGLRAGLRQRIRSELHDLGQLQGLSQFFALSPPTDFDVAHAGCVVLELLGVRAFTLAALRDHQNILVAAGRNTDLLTRFFYRCAIGPVERRRRVALRVAGGPRLRVCFHHDPRTRAIHAGDPGATALEVPIFVYFNQFTQQPDVSVLVLREENDLRFRHLAVLVVDIPHNDGTHAVDYLGEVGHGLHHASRNALLVLLSEPLVDQLSPWQQREPFVVDVGRAIEIVVIERFQRTVGSLALLRQSAAAGQSETNEDHKCDQGHSSLAESDPSLCRPRLHQTHVHRRNSLCSYRSRNGQTVRQRARAAAETQIKCRQDKQVEQRRRHEAAQNDDRHRILYLVARQVAENDQRQDREPGGASRHQDRS